MNEETNSPSSSHPDVGELSSDQLQAIQQRLRAYRPREAELDVQAITEAAAAGDTPSSLAAVRASNGARWIIAVAGSWICGAAVGALVMFGVTEARTPEKEIAQPQSTERVIPPQPQSPGEVEADKKLPSRQADREPQYAQWNKSPLLSPAFLDSLATAHGSRGFLLRAGTHLKSYTPRDSNHADSVSDAKTSTRRLDTRSTGDVPTRPGVTREELMKDLLETDFSALL
jgi:hypothetical protein